MSLYAEEKGDFFMIGFLFGVAVGATGMYFGSDKVRENVEATTQLFREQSQCQEYIQQQTQELLVKWIHEGTLIENLKMYEARLRLLHHEQMNPQVWEDARMLQAMHATR